MSALTNQLTTKTVITRDLKIYLWCIRTTTNKLFKKIRIVKMGLHRDLVSQTGIEYSFVMEFQSNKLSNGVSRMFLCSEDCADIVTIIVTIYFSK